MSDTETPKADKKKGKGKLLLLIGGALIVGGGGGVGGLYAAGMVGGHGGAPKVDRPKLVPKEGASPSDAELDAHLPEGKSPDPAKFQASYVLMPDNFTANLRDTDGLVQLSLGVSTYYDQRVLEAVKSHEMALRSAVLMNLSDQDSLELSTPQGKQKLRRNLRRAINAVLTEKEGFGGIDDVYFTSFVIQ